jgi:hypothetical protein
MDKCQEKDGDPKVDLGQHLTMDIRYPEMNKDPPDETWQEMTRFHELMMKSFSIKDKYWKVTLHRNIF